MRLRLRMPCCGNILIHDGCTQHEKLRALRKEQESE